MAKTQSPFGNAQQRIAELMIMVKNDISSYQERVLHLEDIYLSKRPGNQASVEHAKSLINSLNFSLLSIAKKFAETLETRTEV